MDKKIVKFQIGDLLPIALAFVVTGVAIAYGLQVMGDIKTSMTANSYEANATTDAITGVAKIPQKLPLLATVVVAAVVLGVVIRFLGGGLNN